MQPNIAHPAAQEELQHLAHTLNVVRQETAAAEKELAQAEKELAAARKNDPDMLPLREMLYTSAVHTLHNLEKAAKKPYFTRVDFCEKGGRPEKHYIGKQGVMKSDSLESEVVDYVSPGTDYEEYEPNNSKGYKDGQVIQQPYTGYSVKTYKCRYDKETDELISRDYDSYSTYQKRDTIIVKIVTPETTPPETEAPTETPTEPTETPTEAPTEAPTETPTEAPTEAPTQDPPAEG